MKGHLEVYAPTTQEPVFTGGTPDVTTYAYDDAGNLDTVTLANGVTSDYGYDALSRLAGLLVTQGTDKGSGVISKTPDPLSARRERHGRRAAWTEG